MLPPHHHHLLLFLLLAGAATITAQRAFDYPSANLSTIWTNDRSLTHSVSFPDGSTIRAILRCGAAAAPFAGPTFAFGFYCSSPPCSTFLLAVFIIYAYTGSEFIQLAFPQVVWSANRDRLVAEGATLQLTSGGDLVLRDFDNSTVWSTGTSNLSVGGLNLTSSGNLVLFDNHGAAVWSSFDYPTDTLLIGQSLQQGRRLVANVSAYSWTQGLVYMSILDDGIHAFIDSNPPQLYHKVTMSGTKQQNKSAYITFNNGSLGLFTLFTTPGSPDRSILLPTASSVQYLRLESDGHLRLYEWQQPGWTMLQDVFQVFPDDCAYPTVCGDYGICLKGRCRCPGDSTYDDARRVNLWCPPMNPLWCGSPEAPQMLELPSVSYFNFIDFDAKIPGLKDKESCQNACLSNCSCKAALFQYGLNTSAGSCFLPSHLFSLMDNQPNVTHYNSTAFIKVANPRGESPSSPEHHKTVNILVLLGSVIGSSLAAVFIIIAILLWRRRKVTELDDLDDDQFESMLGMSTRFSFDEMKTATNDFSIKLGEGGFGSVFEGKLADGVKVAVKRLDGVGQGQREFLAEVGTIGSIHHINLVRLIGYCAEKSHRLLVYEYMCNGSLDKWIYRRDKSGKFDWQTRRKIIMHIAKGLTYLHEECRQRIAHLDIKPQNILLDEKFNAKVSDFGLSKLINRDQSQVVTRMRGTPGYLAPEWLSSAITEKVDVYSFGVVVLEIVCGIKNLDCSRPEESIHLAALLQSITEEYQLLDIVDSHSTDMQLHQKEVVGVMKLAMWCIHSDFKRRPSMSVVVKALEGSLDLQPDLEYEISSTTPLISKADGSFKPSASILSGPR